MRQCFSIAILFAAALVDGAAAVGDDTFLFGHDRMAFPRSSSRGRWANWDAQDEDTALRKKMGDDSPLRGGVSVGHPRRHSVGYDLLSILREEIDGDAPARRSVADGRCAVELDWENVGRFLRPIENARQCRWVLRLVRGDDSFDALTPAQLSWVFKEIDRSGAACPLKIARRDIDMESLAKGCFQDNGLWMGHFVLRHGLSLWEYKYAIDRRRRVAAIHRALARMPERRCTRDLENSLDCLSPPVPVPLFLDSPYQPSDLPAELLRCQRANSRWRKFLRAAVHVSDAERMFQKHDALERAAAAGELATLPSHAKPATAGLWTLLEGADPNVRRAAVEAVQEIGPAASDLVPALAAALGREDRAGREAICRALGCIGIAAVPTLRDALRHPGAPRAALTALGEIGPAAKGAVPELRALVHSADRDVRWSAIDALGEIGPAAAAAVPDLRSVLADEHSALQGTAVRSLGLIGPGAKDAVPDLVRILVRSLAPQRPPRACAALAIGRIGPAAKDAVPAVRGALPYFVNPDAAEALDRMGQRFPPARDPSAVARIRRNVSRGWMSSVFPADDCIPMDLLYLLGPWDEPELRKFLSDRDEYIRAAGLRALWHLGPHASASAGDIQRLLEDRFPAVRIAAAEALAAIRPGPNAGAPALVSLLSDGGENARVSAFFILTRLGPAASPSVGALRGILRSDRDEAVRLGAIRVLGSIGPAAKDAIPDLNEIVAHDVWPFTDAAEDAIGAIKK